MAVLVQQLLCKVQSALHADTAGAGLVTESHHLHCGLPEAVFDALSGNAYCDVQRQNTAWT